MSPNSDIIRFSPTPTFAARMLALPALNEAVNRALEVFDSTKSRNDVMGAALRAAEASMRVAASGALPLATPIVNTVGGWGVVDEWACYGLDRVEKAAPIIKKPAQEIVTTTRQTMLKAVAGGTEGGVPESLTAAITVRANSAAEVMSKTRGGSALMNAADQMLVSAHTMVDNYLPPERGDRQGKGVPRGGVPIKVTSLLNKTQQRLYRSVYVIVRPPTDKSLDGAITIAMLMEFGRRTATDVYSEVTREPGKGELQSAGMALVRSTVKLTRQNTEWLREIIQKQLDGMKTIDREAVVQFIQNLMNSSLDITSSAGLYVQGGLNGFVNVLANLVENAGKYRLYLEDMLRKAMSDYEKRDRANRAAAAANSWREKNQMVRVASPPPPAEPSAPTGTVNKAKTPAWHKKLVG